MNSELKLSGSFTKCHTSAAAFHLASRILDALNSKPASDVSIRNFSVISSFS